MRTPPETTDRPRVVVCGTSFGRVYLHAVHADSAVELAGVVSRGSAASQKYAATYGVPCYIDVDQLPADIDIACVVVRAGIVGGTGADLSRQLMARGIHVLQEHLLHPDELTACLRTARENGVQYRVNAFYPHIRAIQRFLVAAELLRRRQRPLFADAVAGRQVLYPLLDVIGRGIGGLRPWRFADPAPPPPDLAALAGSPGPYTHLHGVLGGTPLSLRVQNQIHPADPDNHALLLHRLALAFEAGVLTLADTHGPVLWSPRMHNERDDTGRLIMAGPGTERLDVAGTEPLGEIAGPTFREIFDQVWPDAVRTALGELRAGIADPTSSTAAGQWALTVTEIWHDVTTRLGPPELIHPRTPEPIPLPELVAAENAAREGLDRMTLPPSRWLRCYRPRPQAATKLICFPHAGGAASAYRTWVEPVGPGIELYIVQYPGREDRLSEPFVDRMDTLVEQVTAEIAGLTAGRFALFGHSMGGAVAHEVALRLRGLGRPAPDHLFISGRQPPAHHRGGHVHTRDDRAMADELIRLKPTNAELLAEPELAAIVLPMVRNDYRLIETYRPRHAAPLHAPITVLIGNADTELTAAQARDWDACTDGPVRMHTFPGDHFYLVEHRGAVIDIITDTLNSAAPINLKVQR